MSEGIRLNKALAEAGVCSRRSADEMIFAGKVRVNGQTALSPAMRVGQEDRIEVQGRPVRLGGEEGKRCWLMLNKPVQVVSTAYDPEGRPTVLDFVPANLRHMRLYPVGRLDYFSEGLILLTNDGGLANRLMHPRWHLTKTYLVLVRPERESLDMRHALDVMRGGMQLSEGEKLAPVECREISRSRKGILLEMVLHQGINRQIRRMCRDLSLTVLKLRRIKEGPLSLGDLPQGAVRMLRSSEISALRQAVDLTENLEQD